VRRDRTLADRAAIVPDQRRPNPDPPKPLPASLQVPVQQTIVSYQLAGSDQPLPAWPDQAEAYYKRAGALKDERRFAEALAAFDNAIALKPDYAQAYNGRGIVLANIGRLPEAVGSFDRAIAFKPDYAEAHNNRALVLQDLGQLEEAQASLDRAIALQPDNARAHNNRGVLLHGLKRDDEALASNDRAIALKADYAEAHYNRGIVLHELDRLDDALASFDRAIALKPDYAAAHNNRGALLHDLNRLDEALAAYERAIALTGGFAEAYLNKSYCLLRMGRFGEGWRLHEWRKKTERPVGHRSFAQQLWLGHEDIANKTVFVHWEQGFGDTLQFCRYAKLFRERGANVIMSVQEPLHRLMSRSMPDIRFLRNDVVPAEFDYHCPLMSLPLALGTTLQSVPAAVPYLFADEEWRKTWEARLPPPTRPRIGVVWSGNARQKNDFNRSIGLAVLAPILAVDAHWISLQKEVRETDRALLQSFPQLSHYGELLSDFSETAALIAGLDLVVTVDTSVAHLASAMGKPVWILLAATADWRWLVDRDDCPWYPTARLFRQQAPHAWDNVVERVLTQLTDFVRNPNTFQ
jgi:tetratricopeptide (TPR) repeat protein